MTKPKWYADGLQFECSQCGKCCSGAPGFVWLNEQEISDMAQTMKTDVAAFESKFVRRVGARKSLVEYPDGDCIFLNEKRQCIVYDARPAQCRTWPFWDSNLKSQKTWDETCDVCPGAGTGNLYSIGEIEERRVQRKV